MLVTMRVKQTIIIYTLLIWVTIALFSTIYNLAKAYSDAKTWLPLSDLQKKHLIFGDLYNFFIFLNMKTQSRVSILLYPHTEELFYRGVYDMYPRIITTATTFQQLLLLSQSNRPEFIATYNTIVSIDGYTKFASFSGEKNFGVLYKRK